MKKIRIGNDISVTWSIRMSGEPYFLPGKRLRLFLTSPNNVRMEMTEFSVSENILSFTFYGKDQKSPGIYTLTLIENLGENRMVTMDSCNAFQLVDWSCMAGKDGGSDLILESDASICTVHPLIPVIGENGNWFVEGEDTGKRSYGLSAYEVAVKNGFEGTEEEWLASLSPDLSGIESSIAELMDEVFPLSFATFTGGGSQERGTEVTPAISWSLTRKGAAVDPTAATVNGSTEGVSPGMKSYAATTPISEDTNYEVKVTAGSQSLTRTASYRFLYRKWWGVSDKESLTSEDVLGLSGSQLATGRGLSATAFDCTGGKWPYYVLPAELAGGLECWIGGLRNSDLVTADLEVVNAHGVSHGYKVIRLNERQTGILTIEFR